MAVTVTDDEEAPTLAISGGEATEGNAGTTPLTFTVTKSGGTDQVVTVGYADAGPDGNGHGDRRHRLHRDYPRAAR